jgi:hypothetical protein
MSAVARKLPPIHPGEILREDFLLPMELTPYAVAQACGVPRTRIERPCTRADAGHCRHRAAPGKVFRHDTVVLDESSGAIRSGDEGRRDRRGHQADQADEAEGRVGSSKKKTADYAALIRPTLLGREFSASELVKFGELVRE